MARFLCLFLLFFLPATACLAQSDTVVQVDTARPAPPRPRHVPPRRPVPRPVRTDTLNVIDTTQGRDSLHRDTMAVAVADSLIVSPPVVVQMRFDSLVFMHHPFYQFHNPVRRMESVRVRTDGKEYLFYCVMGLLLFFALLRNLFGRYLQDLFRLFFRSSLKQRQAKEQLMEAYLPSLLLNLLFVLSGALFAGLLLRQSGLGLNFSFWILLLYCAAGLAAVYFVKFITLRLCGWIFRVSEATATYTFIVFTTNKVVGIALLPFIVLLAFCAGTIYQVAFTLSLLLVGALFLYRYFLSYTSVQRQVRLSFFHFALYLVAFEIIPLLLINKVLFRFLG